MTPEEARLKLKDLADNLGMPVDDRIKSLIIGLWINGIETTGSCEGHLGWGEPFPWVDIETEEPEGLKSSKHKQNKWKSANSKQSDKFKQLLNGYRESVADPHTFVVWNKGTYGAVRFEIKEDGSRSAKSSLAKLQNQANDFGEYLIDFWCRDKAPAKKPAAKKTTKK